MNRGGRADDASALRRLYRLLMALRLIRWAAPRQALALDGAIVLFLAAATEWRVWIVGNVAGPRWLTAALPLLLDLPLLARRRSPLLALALVVAGVATQALVSGDAAEGVFLLGPLVVGVYSVAVHAQRRRALVGLALVGTGGVVHDLEDRQLGSGAQLWAAAFFWLGLVAVWLVGVFVHSRREAAALTAQAAALQHEAQVAVGEERARIARELHDIVSHNLSVVVLQAAGARASGASPSTLEKIERSGREALVEMRRLLGVLREDGEPERLAPHPGIGQLETLAASVRAAGMPVELSVEGDCGDLPPGVELAAYRIIQEALTNTLKHAGPARARVHVRRGPDALIVEVLDDGVGARDRQRGGHGLVGMRERVAVFAGELQAGSRPEGGFAVRARLPLAGERP